MGKKKRESARQNRLRKQARALGHQNQADGLLPELPPGRERAATWDRPLPQVALMGPAIDVGPICCSQELREAMTALYALTEIIGPHAQSWGVKQPNWSSVPDGPGDLCLATARITPSGLEVAAVTYIGAGEAGGNETDLLLRHERPEEWWLSAGIVWPAAEEAA